MSVTTILEAYDAQMDYSGDFDVAMHTAGSSGDAWLYQGETVMDQDAHHDSQSTGATDRQSVEVDMDETYPDNADNESVEYEMADEEGFYPQGADLLDVEVYDASQLHSPIPMPATVDTPQITSGGLVDFTPHETLVFSDPHNSVEPSTTTLQEKAHLHERSVDQLPIRDPSPQYDAHEVSDAAVASTERQTEQPVEPLTDVQTIADHLPHTALETEATTEVAESSNSTVLSDNSGHAHSEETESMPSWPNQQEHETSTDLNQLAEAEHHESEECHDEVLQYYEYNETAADTADPHEISEGVYIDPPPAVLLSLPSSDQPEFCLFNQPQSRAESLSPTEEARPPRQLLTVLLHHRPTLYYEPLTNVFEALRQEEYITCISEFVEGELALNAYDLQLIVSEDNAHAREVTLHDLNVLHDGSDLSGPLRLQLHVIVPRFILRYHMLRDQITRLNLIDGEEESGQSKEHYGENTEEYHRAEEYQQEDVQFEQTHEDQQGQRSDQQQAADQTEVPAPDYADEQATGDVSNLTAEDHNYHQVHTHETEILDNENQYAYVDTDASADAGENFDLKAVSDNGRSAVVAAPVGEAEPTEYEDYAEVAEFDEQYGEELPEQDVSDSAADSSQKSGFHAIDHDQEPADIDETIPELNVGEAADLSERIDDQSAGEDHFADGDLEETFENINKTNGETATRDNFDHDSVDTAINHNVPGLAESDSNLVPVLRHEVDLTDLEPETSTSKTQRAPELELAYPDLDDDHEWDDDLDAEGEIDATWPVDHDDGVSNQSSATLSSTTSIAKRGYDELDFEDDGDSHSPHHNSPQSKRTRVE